MKVMAQVARGLRFGHEVLGRGSGRGIPSLAQTGPRVPRETPPLAGEVGRGTAAELAPEAMPLPLPHLAAHARSAPHADLRSAAHTTSASPRVPNSIPRAPH